LFDAKETSKKIIEWLKDEVYTANAEGAVFGLSGGIDSAVVAVLCKKAFPNKCLALIMPCHSNPVDAQYAQLVADKFNIETKTVILDTVFDTLVNQLGDDPRAKKLSVSNIKPRLRMITLYYFSAERNYLVIGTGNKSELTVGYFTKYGDGGVDLLPLGNLVKSQVRELAQYLGVPNEIIERPPTAGLWENQTDEGEMGITYETLDKYILTGNIEDEKIAEKIERMKLKSTHKIQSIKIFSA
jgi:NAD+ synthase